MGVCRSHDFYRILTEPETNMIRQQQALMQTEGVQMEFTDAAIREIAKVAEEVNLLTQCTKACVHLCRAYCLDCSQEAWSRVMIFLFAYRSESSEVVANLPLAVSFASASMSLYSLTLHPKESIALLDSICSGFGRQCQAVSC